MNVTFLKLFWKIIDFYRDRVFKGIFFAKYASFTTEKAFKSSYPVS